MNLIDENYNKEVNHKKLIVFCGTAIVILIFAIIILLAIASTFKKSTSSLVVDGKSYAVSKLLKESEGELYIGIEDLIDILSGGYTYKRGSKDGIDENKCYISNLYETTYFEVGSKNIRKELQETKEITFFELEKPIIKDNNKICIPLSGVDIAMNAVCNNTEVKISISSIKYLENYYTSTSMIQDKSVVWDVSYSNKKLLKNRLVIIQDSEGKYGIATISTSAVNKKTKKSTILTLPLVDPKYSSIRYIEKYNMFIVETSTGKGILKLKSSDSEFSVEQKVGPQYESIYPINERLYKVSKTDSNKNVKYGVIDENGDIVVPVEYDSIGIDISKYDDLNINNSNILFDSLIPVQKNKLYGLVDTKGNVIVKIEYDGLGCVENNIGSNVLIIPDLNGIVVRKSGKYGIVGKNGKIIANADITKIYKEVIEQNEEYNMVYNNKKHNIVTYFGGTQQTSGNTTSVPKK